MLSKNTKDMTGKTFNRWTVLSFHSLYKNGSAVWLCECECGTKRTVNGARLRRGASRSCGCLRNEEFGIRSYKTGSISNAAYKSWQSMINRCTNINFENFNIYGGRGISICERWIGENGFANFLQDMGERPKGMTLDRIDVNGNYEPSNCRWLSNKLQQRNKRNNVVVEVNGFKGCLSAACEHFNLNIQSVYSRLRKGWPIKKAFTTPIRLKRQDGDSLRNRANSEKARQKRTPFGVGK
jgi:hypothetical protein